MTQRVRGFTLVEMLVAISVAALLVSLVYGSVRVGQRSAAALNGRIEGTEVMRIGWQYLHGALTRARPVLESMQSENPTGFHGEAGRLSFIADMPAYVGLGGLVRIRLDTAEADAGTRLIVSRERFGAESVRHSEGSVEQAVLLDELDRMALAYFGQKEPDEAPAWHAGWDGPEYLPNLVRIEIKPLGERAWPVLIARPLSGSVPLPEDVDSRLLSEVAE